MIRDKVDKLTPIIDLDELERFVTEREYEAIPDVFPEDYGKIGDIPSIFDGMYEMVLKEVKNKGGFTNFLLMRNEDGDINYWAFLSIYSALILTLVSLYYIFKDAKNEMKAQKIKSK